MNKKLLLEDVKFPLSWDSDEYKMYIFDAEMSMIAQIHTDIDSTKLSFRGEHPFEKLVGDYKEVEIHKNNPFKLYQGDFIDMETGRTIGMVRGWGGITSKLINQGHEDWEELGVKKQDNIAEYILNVINS